MNHPSKLKQGSRVIGEFFLIVISVLVALAVDQYAERREEREQEGQYLVRLAEDVESTGQSIRTTQGSFLRAEIAARYLDSLLADPPARTPPASTLYIATQSASRWYTPTYQKGTLDEMKSVGGLRLVRDQEVRERVLRFFAWEETHDLLFDDIDTRFRTFSRSLQIPSSDERFFETCPPEIHPADCEVNVPGINGEALWLELRSSPEVNGMLRHLIRDTYRSQELLSEHLVRADSLVDLLRRVVER